MEQRRELAEHGAETPGGVQVRHVVLAGRLQIHQNRRLVAQRVEAPQRDFDAHAPGHRGQMDDGVRGATDRQEHAERVLDRPRRDDLARPQTRRRQRHGLLSARLRRAQPVGVNRGDRRRPRQRHAERLRERGHRTGRAHHGARARRRRQVRLDALDLHRGDPASAVLGPEAPAIRARAQALTTVVHRHHGPRQELDGGHVGRRGAHELSRDRLVAAAHQHDGVHRLRADHLLDVHGHEVAEHHARRGEEHLAERDRREVDREPAGGEHAALHRLDQLGEMPVAVVEAARRLRDADHRPRQHRLRVAHRRRERAAQVERKVSVAVVGEAPPEAAGAVRHHHVVAMLPYVGPVSLAEDSGGPGEPALTSLAACGTHAASS